MTWTDILMAIIPYVVGIIVGINLSIVLFRSRYEGVLRIDKRDPERDLYSLDLNVDLDEMSNMKYVVFKVEKTCN